MTTTTHTPGPWTIRESMATNSIGMQIEVYQICESGIGIAETWGEDRARLIAAAPDLLATLEALLEDAVTLGIDDSNVSGGAMQARAAIAKARGEVR